MGANMPIMGGDSEFETSNIFSTDCAVAKFRGTNDSKFNSLDALELPSKNCASGMDGQGVVCKK